MKKKHLFSLLIALLLFAQMPVIAEDLQDEFSVDERIAAVGFGKMFSADPQKEITNLFKKMDSYTEKKDLKRIRALFSDDFVNNDGFDIDIYMKSLKSGFDTYSNRTVTTKINSISVNDDYAIVHVTENGEAETLKPTANIEGYGLVIASADVYYFLKRNGKSWKITSANVMDENCSILYGTAKNIYFSLNVPTQVKAGTEYTSSLSFAPIKDTLVAASLSTEPIVFPLPMQREDFKTVKNDGVLERLFVANSDNYNEYAIAAIGMTKPQIISQDAFNLKLVGTAFVIRRVNVVKPMKNSFLKNGKKADKDSVK